MSKPTLWPTRMSSPAQARNCRAASTGLGAAATSASVMPWICFPTMPRLGFASVEKRSRTAPPLTRTAPISTSSPILTSRLVVSVSKTTKERPASAAATNSTTELMSGSMKGTRLALPTCARSCSWSSMTGCSERWPNMMASAMTDSGRILAPASTIMMASRVPETTRSSSDCSSWLVVGLTMNSPSMRPMRTAATGPRKGISLMVSAAEAAMVPRTSGSFSWSVESTVRTHWTSSL